MTGCYTALITPFTRDGSVIDWPAFEALIERQVTAGVSGIVVAGTTGESPTITHEEHMQLVERAVLCAKGACEIVAGTGSNATEESLQLAKAAKKAGADYQLIVNPYYNKPTQEGMKQHFTAVAEAGPPAILYNIQGRTSINVCTRTMAELSRHPHIVGVKEASGDIGQILDVLHEVDSSFAVLAGDDALTLPVMAAGGVGVVSVLGNALPGPMQRLTELLASGDMPAARKLHTQLFPLMKAGFLETNPIPIKKLCSLLGLCEETMRLPLTAATPATTAQLTELLPGIQNNAYNT